MKATEKRQKIIVATLIVITLILLIQAPKALDTISENTVFSMSSNNAQFTVGLEYNFYLVQVNANRLWMDQSYASKYYTQYCIYVDSPNDTAFTILRWFPEANSTAQLRITSPLATNINLSLYSPNFIAASATGVVSYSYNNASQTLNMIGNTDTNTVITISATVNQTAINIPPENVSISITDMEGCGEWVFAGEQFYHFQARFWDGDGYGDIDTTQIAFYDGATWVNASYDQSANAFELTSGSDIVNLQSGTITIVDSNLLQIIYEIYFENYVIDALDVDLYMWCNDTSGESDGWDLMESDYFNIYNLGGHSILTTNGNAGRYDTGDVFDLYAYNNSWAQASMTFRNLQHVKMLPLFNITVRDPFAANNPYLMEYFIHYCTEDDIWQPLYRLRISIRNGTGGGSAQYMRYQISHWQYNPYLEGYAQIYVEDIYTYSPATSLPDQSNIRLWVDIWINKMNASSLIGGRVNAYYYPMTDSSNPWLRWLTGSNWGKSEQRKESMAFAEMLALDSDGELVVLHSQSIKLMRITCYIDKGIQTTYDDLFSAHNYDVFDLTIGPRPFTGIQTPVFDETKVPVMPQGGFLGALFSVFSQFGTWISNALGPAILGFWELFVGFLDSVAEFFGYPGLFSTLFSMIADFFTWFTSSIIYVVNMLTPIFLLFGETLGKFATLVSTVVGQWISMFQQLFAFLDGTYTAGVNVWDDLGGIWWLTIGAILYPVYLLFLWDQRGIDAVINQLKFIIDVMAMLIHGLITVIQFVIGLIHKIIESIPVVE